MLYLGLVLVGGGAFWLGLLFWPPFQDPLVQKRLGQLAGITGERRADLTGLYSMVGGGVEKFLPPTVLAAIRREVSKCGYSDGNEGARRVITMVVVLWGFLLVVVKFLGIGIMGLLAGVLTTPVVAWGWLRNRASERKRLFLQQFPFALDLVNVAVEAGLSFEAALSSFLRRGRGPVAEEFQKVQKELELGRTRQEALRNLLTRMDIPEVRSFVITLIQADQMGTSMAKVLRALADQIRLRRSQIAQEAAMKAPVKIVFPMVFCIFPALLIVLFGPLFLNGGW